MALRYFFSRSIETPLFQDRDIYLSTFVFSYFFLIICSAEDPISTLGLQGDMQRHRLHLYLRDYLPRKPHLVHKRLQTGELQKEMSSASSRHWVTEAAI